MDVHQEKYDTGLLVFLVRGMINRKGWSPEDILERSVKVFKEMGEKTINCRRTLSMIFSPT
jgi:hypothetical protein